MALNTALTVGVLSIATIRLLGAANPINAVDGSSTTARLSRRLLIVSLASRSSWHGYTEGWPLGLYDTSYGTSFGLARPGAVRGTRAGNIDLLGTVKRRPRTRPSPTDSSAADPAPLEPTARRLSRKANRAAQV